LIQLPGGWWTARYASLAQQLMAAISSHAAARRLLGLPIIYTAALFAASGLGFAGANLILARLLSTSDFALVVLAMALLNVSIPLAPAGMDGVINRHTLDFGPSLLGRVLATSAIVGLITATLARTVYGLDALAGAILFSSIIAGGTTYLTAAHLRSRHQFVLSITLGQSSTYLFVVAAMVTLGAPIRTPDFVLGVIMVGLVAAAAWIWLRYSSKEPAGARRDVPWHDGLFYVGAQAAGLLLLSMERLIIPKLLTFEDLATFGVLSAVALAPYRILQMAVGFALLPQLRAAKSGEARRNLVAREVAVCAVIVMLGSLVVWWLAPPVAAWFVGDKYPITPMLLLAAIVAGSIRVAASIPRSAATALCTTEDLGRLAGLTWVAVGCAVLGAWLGSAWGLPGIMYGVAFGGLVHGLAAARVSARYLREA
jgi:O-antigen/teichoic acid export membrane protein